jgi:tetratricopeptide (TPR) repeat protein
MIRNALLRHALGGLIAVSVLLPGAEGFSQKPRKKPVLIRDTAIAEGKEDTEKEKRFNPMMAEESVKVGKFYLKQKNYKAAIARFLEALEYQPNLIEAFEALGKAYEKAGDADKALAVYKDFLEKYPFSPKAKDFKSKIAKLEKRK